MDENKKDESRNRIREEALARRVGEAFDRLEPPKHEECPDASLVAAYYERALEPAEIAGCEAHFANCARCRKVMAVLAAAADAPLAETEVARLGQLVTEAKPARPRVDKEAAKWWQWQWLAPAFGVAAVLALWFAVRPMQKSSEPTAIVAQSSAPAAETSALPNSNGEPSAGPTAGRQNTISRRSGYSKAGEPLATGTSGSGTLGERAKKSADSAEQSSNDGTDKKERGELDSLQASRAAPPAERPVPELALSSRGRVAGGVAPPTSAISVAPAPQAPAAEALSAGNAPTATTEQKQLATPQVSSQLKTMSKAADANKVVGAFGAVTILLKSPSGTVSWRVGNVGSIERSTDGGRTWTPQQSPLREDWLAGAAVSDSICWLVGRNGSIARTVDGLHWERLAAPTQSASSSGRLSDWIAITPRDAQSATVTAGDGRHYSTQDGGKTWRVE